MASLDPGDQIRVARDCERWRTSELETELSALLNRVSAEKGSDTPDFILAAYLFGALDAFKAAVRHREAWYGRALGTAAGPVPALLTTGPAWEVTADEHTSTD